MNTIFYATLSPPLPNDSIVWHFCLKITSIQYFSWLNSTDTIRAGAEYNFSPKRYDFANKRYDIANTRNDFANTRSDFLTKRYVFAITRSGFSIKRYDFAIN